MGDMAIRLFEVLLAALLGGGLIGAWVTLRKDRRQAPIDSADAMRDLLRQAARATAQAAEAWQKAADAQRDAADARVLAGSADRRAAHAEQEAVSLRHELTWIVMEVRPIITWIEAGAAPPPPQLSARLLKVLDEAAIPLREDDTDA